MARDRRRLLEHFSFGKCEQLGGFNRAKEKFSGQSAVVTYLTGKGDSDEIHHNRTDVVRAVVAQRGHSNEEALAVLSLGNNVSIGVITFDPFQEADADEGIKVRLKWRSVTRGMFSD
jgi:hypothetical protein